MLLGSHNQIQGKQTQLLSQARHIMMNE